MNRFEAAVIEQNYIFDVYSALTNGPKDDLHFKAWIDFVHPSLTMMKTTTAVSHSTVETIDSSRSFSLEIYDFKDIIEDA